MILLRPGASAPDASPAANAGPFVAMHDHASPSSGPVSSDLPAAMSVADLEAFLAAEFPQMFNARSGIRIEAAWYHGARVRQAFRPEMLRPGGTVSGPVMMALADVALYVAVLSSIGPVPLAVTTSFNINFLRRPAQRDLLAEAKLMKLGKRLAVGEVAILSEGHPDPVAHVTATYSIPARHSA